MLACGIGDSSSLSLTSQGKEGDKRGECSDEELHRYLVRCVVVVNQCLPHSTVFVGEESLDTTG